MVNKVPMIVEILRIVDEGYKMRSYRATTNATVYVIAQLDRASWRGGCRKGKFREFASTVALTEEEQTKIFRNQQRKPMEKDAI